MPEPGEIQLRLNSRGAHVRYVWVICPLCEQGRWVYEGRTKQLNFSGVCRICYLEIARKGMARFQPGAKGGRMLGETQVPA